MFLSELIMCLSVSQHFPSHSTSLLQLWLSAFRQLIPAEDVSFKKQVPNATSVLFYSILLYSSYYTKISVNSECRFFIVCFPIPILFFPHHSR